MNEEKKRILFELMDRAERDRDEADPNYEPDNLYFGYYNALDDAILALGLAEEYRDWKKASKNV